MRRLRYVWLVGVLLAVRATADEGISFDEALGLAGRAPQVLGGARAVAVKHAHDQQISSQTQHPQVSVQPGFRFAPSGARQPELLVEVLHTWNLSGFARMRRQAAHAEEAVLSAEARLDALTQRLGAAWIWIELWAAQRALDAAREQERLAAALTGLVARSARLGETTAADLADARALEAEAELARIGAEGEVYERGIQLAEAVGRVVDRPLQATGELPQPMLPPPSEWPRYLAQAAAMPEVERRALMVQAARARALEERASRGLLGQFGGVVQRDSPGGLVVSASARLYLPLFDRGERERAVLLAQAEREAGARDAALVTATAELVMAFHEVEHSGERLRALETHLVPESEAGARLRERIYQAGEASLPEVLAARRIAMSAAQRLVRARAEHLWSKVRVWLLLGTLAQANAEVAP